MSVRVLSQRANRVFSNGLMTKAVAAAVVLGLGAAAGLIGCSSSGGGYRIGSLHDSSVRTIAVPMFENQTYANGLEAQLTEAVITEIQRTTPWRVVPSEQAQTTLAGSITQAQLRTLATDRGYVEQNAYALTVDFSWSDNARGDVLVARQNFSSVGSFIPVLGVQESIEVGQRDAISEMARDIVATLASDW